MYGGHVVHDPKGRLLYDKSPFYGYLLVHKLDQITLRLTDIFVNDLVQLIHK